MTDTTWPMPQPDRAAKGLWWDRAWSLVEGCEHCSAGCLNCWSAALTHRRAGDNRPAIQSRYAGLTTPKGRWNGQVRTMQSDLDKPLAVRTPQVWAVWNDLFHMDVSLWFMTRAFEIMHQCPQHYFVILTKRPRAALGYTRYHRTRFGDLPWRDNIAIGTTVEDNDYRERIDDLVQIPATRIVSAEPLLGPLDLRPWLDADNPQIDAVVFGGETGHRARPMNPRWAEDLLDQLIESDTPAWFKSWGEWAPASADSLDAPPMLYPGVDPIPGRAYVPFAWSDRLRSYRVGAGRSGRTIRGTTWNQMPACPTLDIEPVACDTEGM